MELKDTVKRMCSDDPKAQLIAEYQQVEIRLEKLKEFMFKFNEGILTFDPPSTWPTYAKQRDAMEEYLEALTQRIKDEKIPGFGCFGDHCNI